MGNGKDTYFLYDLIGTNGRLYAFDIQKASIENTIRLFAEAGVELSENIQLIQDGHENLARHITEPIDCGVFNLGYLPGGNHEVVTKPDTTLIALKAMLGLLKAGGVVVLTIYYGHKGGKEEKECLLAYLEELPFDYFNVMKWYTINNKNNPPIVAVIEKK
jgi:SAM-dependent methyltransferase